MIKLLNILLAIEIISFSCLPIVSCKQSVRSRNVSPSYPSVPVSKDKIRLNSIAKKLEHFNFKIGVVEFKKLDFLITEIKIRIFIKIL